MALFLLQLGNCVTDNNQVTLSPTAEMKILEYKALTIPTFMLSFTIQNTINNDFTRK